MLGQDGVAQGFEKQVDTPATMETDLILTAYTLGNGARPADHLAGAGADTGTKAEAKTTAGQGNKAIAQAKH